MKSIRLLSALVASLALCSCGGGGLLGLGPALSLRSSISTINYGETVTISWNSDKMTSIRTADTNFPIASGLFDGSYVDTPADTTTYILTMRDEDGSDHTKSLTVTVRPLAKKFLFLSDQSVAGMPQIKEEIGRQTSLPVDTSLTLPSLINADVIVISETASVGPANHAAINAFLSAGGRVVLIGRAPRVLATGNISSSNISAIGSWFMGTTSCGGLIAGGGWMVKPNAVSGLPLSAVHHDENLYQGYRVQPVSASALELGQISGAAAAYSVPSGGKAAYVAGAPVGSSDSELTTMALFKALCRWAASDL